ncbi:MAG: uracil phosphoribosyltransferase [Opitutales bacterium]
MALTVLQHPLATHFLNTLRSTTTGPGEFRRAGERLTSMLALEATRHLGTRAVEVETPLERFASEEPSMPTAIVGILRAGIGMVEPMQRWLPEAAVGLIGMERDEATAEARAYYEKLPPLEGRHVFVVDPMLATGGSALDALERVLAQRPAAVHFLCIVAAPEGVERLRERFPELALYCGVVDRGLNDQAYILPGLGDYGDRLFGTY